MPYRVESITARPLRVPLADPFVIASGRIDETRAALVSVTLRDEVTDALATGLGEAAALPPVTREDLPDLLPAVIACDAALRGRVVDDVGALTIPDVGAVTSAAVECALLDAQARLRGVPLWRMLLREGEAAATTLVSDITIPIHAPAYMGELAARWRAKGFTCFKVKVGIDPASDLAALAAIVARVPDATFRVDANGGYDAATAVAFYARATQAGARIACFEQPCARDDLDGMATVTRSIAAPVVADESVRSLDDLARVVARGAARGVNLKLVKSGVMGSLALGRRAKGLGLEVMFGAMVETRLGIAAAAHVCAALGGVDYVDLDTAWLMKVDPFCGGYTDEGPVLTVSGAPGVGVSECAGAVAFAPGND
jgi:L-alanine-DL-glutamate epimerase-like enolase superfamily enzyme